MRRSIKTSALEKLFGNNIVAICLSEIKTIDITLMHTFKYLCSVTIFFIDTIDGADKSRYWIIFEAHINLIDLNHQLFVIS